MNDATADSIVCFAGVDWWYHNRGHSECQIMTRLARQVPVLWVNSIAMRTPAPGRTQLALRRYARKLGSLLRGLRRDESGMWVYSPLFIPIYTEATLALNGRLIGHQVDWLCRRLGFERPAVWVTVPTAAPAVAAGRYTRVVFNRSDEFSAFPEVRADLIRPLEERLLQRSDHVLYVSRTLCERERRQARSAHYLGHGVDFDHFANARGADGIVSRIREIAGPILGFYGALDDYTIDLELLLKVARRFRDATLVIIGPKAMDIGSLEREPNVVYLGPVPYGILPACAAEFDVGLMPWRTNDWIAACNPIKLKEYLALGFPIVTTPFDALGPYERLVAVGRTHDEFLAAITRALAEDDPARRAQRRQAVAGDGWDGRAARAAEWLGLDSPGLCAAA